MNPFSLAILLALSAIMIFSFGCAQKPAEPSVVEPPAVEPPQNATVSAEPCSSGNIVQKDGCFAALAKSKSDPEICKNVYSVEKLDSCFAYFAGNNLEVCKQITDAPMRQACLTENARRINSSESEAVCSLIDNAEARAACLRQVVPPCRLVLDPDQRALCVAFEKNDYTFCTSDTCFAQYAENRSDSNACNLINNSASRYSCFAVVKNDVGECKNAPLVPVQDYCIEKSAEALDSVNGCDLASAGGDYRNRCYLYFAVKGRQGSICARAEPEFSVGSSGTSRYWCYGQYATQAADVSVCPKILESQSRIGCYYTAAKKNSMPSLCNPLNNAAWMKDCYAGSILYVEGGPVPADCMNVQDQTWKDKCYYKAALATANSTMCGFITPGTSDRDSCDSAFGQQ